MIVAGANRTVIHLDLTANLWNFYWDKATGVIVKMDFVIFSAWYNYTMTSTNMWSSGLSTTTLLVIGGLLILVIFVVALLLLRRRRRRPRRRQQNWTVSSM